MCPTENLPKLAKPTNQVSGVSRPVDLGLTFALKMAAGIRSLS